MTPETAKRLRDARKYAFELQGFIAGRSDQDFMDDRALQLAVHKLIELIGFALGGARKHDPEIADSVPNLHRFIDLADHINRNYDMVDYPALWDVARVEVPQLIDDLDEILRDVPLPE